MRIKENSVIRKGVSMLQSRGGSSRGAAGLHPSLKNVRQKIQRRRSCDDVFSTHADEFGDFGAVFGTALKERNQTTGYKKHGCISAYRKAFLLF